MKSSSYIDLQRFMLIPTKFPLILKYFVKFTIQSFPCLICSITNRGSLNVNSTIINDFHHHFSVFACYQVQI